MKKSFPSFVAAILIALLAPASRSEAAPEPVTFQVFYDALSPYGDWINVDGYGYCWRPQQVDPGWRPYSVGYWAMTDQGWTWVSNEDWGWATYHYGRWANLEGTGWIWVPGYDWAPAWVSWRQNNDYIGWAPLPPEAVWDANGGFGDSVDVTYDIGPGYYNFCPVADFGAEGLRQELIPYTNNVSVFINSTNITFINYQNDGVFCGGPNWDYVNRSSHRQIPQYQLERRWDYGGGGRWNGKNIVQGNTLNVVAPQFVQGYQTRPARVSGSAQRNQATLGWNAVQDSNMRDQVRQASRQQLKDQQGGNRFGRNGSSQQNNLTVNPSSNQVAVPEVTQGRNDNNPRYSDNNGNRYGDTRGGRNNNSVNQQGVTVQQQTQQTTQDDLNAQRREAELRQQQFEAARNQQDDANQQRISQRQQQEQQNEAQNGARYQEQQRQQQERQDALNNQRRQQQQDDYNQRQNQNQQQQQLAQQQQYQAQQEAARQQQQNAQRQQQQEYQQRQQQQQRQQSQVQQQPQQQQAQPQQQQAVPTARNLPDRKKDRNKD